jgi:hypothetical protein
MVEPEEATESIFAEMVSIHPAQGPHARAPLRVPQRRRQGQTGALASPPRRAHPTTAARTGAAPGQVPVLRQADAARQPHQPPALVACAAEPSPTPSRTPSIESMNPPKPHCCSLPSQRTTLARKSTPSTLKTTPDHPAFQARSDTQTVQRSALTTRSHRTTPKVLTNAGVKHEANRIHITRFVGARP